MYKRRLTIDMFPGGFDDRILRRGDIVDEKIVCSTIGTYGSELKKYCTETHYGVVIAQNPGAYTKKYIGGLKLLHTFVRGNLAIAGNWVYKGMCKEGCSENYDPAHAKRVFVVSRYSGDTEKNIEYARDICAQVVREGDLPIAPHLLFPQFLEDSNEMERAIGIEAGHVMMESCDMVLVATCGDELSEGMKADIEYAANLGIPIEYGEF